MSSASLHGPVSGRGSRRKRRSSPGRRRHKETPRPLQEARRNFLTNAVLEAAAAGASGTAGTAPAEAFAAGAARLLVLVLFKRTAALFSEVRTVAGPGAG